MGSIKYLSLKEIHRAESDMLLWLNELCNINGINLCLSGGTLLGAIRHRGFIPWDDDIDLMLARDEYDKLLDILEKTEHDKYVVISKRDGKSSFAYAKLIDKSVYIKEEKNTQEVTANLWIDIFPVDGLPENENKIRRSYKRAKLYRMGLRVSTSHDLKAGSTLKRIIKPFVYFPAKIIGTKTWLNKLDGLCRKIPFGSTNNVGVICAGYGKKECMPYFEWIKYDTVEFEGHSYRVPGCWELYLKSLYGDYMTLPPEDKRHTHNLVAYTDQ